MERDNCLDPIQAMPSETESGKTGRSDVDEPIAVIGGEAAGSVTPLYLVTGSRFSTAGCMYAECDYY